MRVSDYYKLGVGQPVLDFVDVDVTKDLRVFIDPRALRLLHSQWGSDCVFLLQNFFETVLAEIRNGHDANAKRLLSTLREPNETHLGLSTGASRGRALGPESAGHMWDALRKSEAVTSGLLQDLEDSILMIDGVSDDIISDIATNVIRAPLILYTQQMCEYHNIATVPDVDSGPLWDPHARDWHSQFVSLPMPEERKLILVPKVIVRRRMDYASDEYFRHYILEHLRDRELSANSELVKTLKDGRKRVYKSDLIAKYGSGKKAVVRETLRWPDLLGRYKTKKAERPRGPLAHEDLANEGNSAAPDWDDLVGKVASVPVGREAADEYEKRIKDFLTAFFYPSLSHPIVQHQIHDGRKRIDITYTNSAQDGFFGWLSHNYPAAYVFVECKNYGHDVANPELDQLSGRFSPSRGQVGFLVCRSFSDKGLFTERCKDTAKDHRGYVIALDDDDLRQLVGERETEGVLYDFGLLRTRFDELVM